MSKWPNNSTDNEEKESENIEAKKPDTKNK
jgi:hypothetical protein